MTARTPGEPFPAPDPGTVPGPGQGGKEGRLGHRAVRERAPEVDRPGRVVGDHGSDPVIMGCP